MRSGCAVDVQRMNNERAHSNTQILHNQSIEIRHKHIMHTTSTSQRARSVTTTVVEAKKDRKKHVRNFFGGKRDWKYGQTCFVTTTWANIVLILTKLLLTVLFLTKQKWEAINSFPVSSICSYHITWWYLLAWPDICWRERGAETWGFRESPGYVEKELNPITENTPCWKP